MCSETGILFVLIVYSLSIGEILGVVYFKILYLFISITTYLGRYLVI